jgi:hypothetical protein
VAPGFHCETVKPPRNHFLETTLESAARFVSANALNRIRLRGRIHPAILYSHPAEGFWDDGEWVSWDWINEQLAQQERRDEFPAARPEIVQLFDAIVQIAIEYRETTGRYLPDD